MAAKLLPFFIASLFLAVAFSTPDVSTSAAVRQSFPCPQDLIFMFDCSCFFASRRNFKLQPFEFSACRKRTRQLRGLPGRQMRVARRCRQFVALTGGLKSTALEERRDETFKRCPAVRRKLCPFDEEYDVLRCVCYLVQTGRIEGNKKNCDRDFGKVNRKTNKILRKRCASVVNFKQFAGVMVGLTVRYCGQGFKRCCRALPAQPPAPPA